MKLYTDSLHKIVYATDASVYREIPYGVAYPETVNDVQELLRMAHERKTHLIPRAGGTSIAGQVVGSGIVVDISKHWNHILEINKEEQWARVEPGVVRDELNIALKPYGLFFSPETSTSNRCCIGGMFGNNSCGTHSLVYGSTRHHVVACKGVLADGTLFDTENVNRTNSLLDKILTLLETWASDDRVCKLIEENYPDKDLQRRSCGYAIDEAIELVNSNKGLALCKLLAGSEGTLAFITEIKVSLDVLPPKEIMVVCGHCNTLDKSFEANLVALRHNPTAIELMDGDILELSKGNAEQQKNRFFVEGDPAALLITELRAETREELDKKAEALEKDLLESGLVYLNTRVYGADVSKVWALRKAGLGILGGMKGDAKPMGVIEDTAVSPKYMPSYMKEFQEMTHRLGANVVYYGHISTGELHLRPILNLKTKEGQALFRNLATETAQLVKKHRGSISGEHGDGRLRGEFIKMLYGDDAYELMRQVKHCWDPEGMFNLHKIVDTLPMDSMLRFDIDQQYSMLRFDIDQQYDIEKRLGSDKTYFNWKAAFDECKAPGATGAKSQMNALMCSIEQCNGTGDCRKSNLIGGILCPAYKVSGDELKTTRARANVLREILTRGGNYTQVKEELDSCLACKGCKSECPSNVDMTRIRAEVLQHYYDEHGTPFRSFMVARMAQIEQLGAMVRPLYNFFASWSLSSNLIKKVICFSTERQIPTLSRYSMRKLVAKEQAQFRIARPKKKVYLFADEFTNLQEAELGLTFAKLLMRLGYQVEIPNHVESGRAAISKGCLKYAKKFAIKNVQLLKDIVCESHPLIGIEPSCILSFRDEYPDLVPAELRKDALELAKNSLLYDEFLMREIAEGNISAEAFENAKMEIWLHGHCHQKALVGVDKTAKVLDTLLSGSKVNVIPSGCCGMAGSFGYEKEHYKTSLAIGEMILFPAVRKAVSVSSDVPVIVAAPGTSCRQQIMDGTRIKAVHPIEILYRFFKID